MWIPLSLQGTAIGLLLVFRTDTAYNRFKEGSPLAWEVTASMRSYIRRLVAWTGRAAVRRSCPTRWSTRAKRSTHSVVLRSRVLLRSRNNWI